LVPILRAGAGLTWDTGVHRISVEKRAAPAAEVQWGGKFPKGKEKSWVNSRSMLRAGQGPNGTEHDWSSTQESDRELATRGETTVRISIAQRGASERRIPKKVLRQPVPSRR
jgi:hypothetical protein